MKRNAFLAARLAVTGGLAYVVLRKASWLELQAVLENAASEQALLGWAVALPGLGVVVAVWRWRTLLSAGGLELRFDSLLKAFLVGNFFNQLLPSTVGGDFVRGWRVRNEARGVVNSLAIVALDRIIGLSGIVVAAAFALAIKPEILGESVRLHHIGIVLLGAGALTIVFSGLRLWSRFKRTAELASPKLKQAMESFDVALTQMTGERSIALAGLLSIGLQGVLILDFYVLAKIFHCDLSLLEACLLIPLVSLATSIPVSINGIGVREATLAIGGSAFGLSAAGAAAMAWTFVAVSLLYALVGGAIQFFEGVKDHRLQTILSHSGE